ncbi:MAG: class I SAM-dependent methyltransferase [Candidatus Humimicrobiaceae bacterium]
MKEHYNKDYFDWQKNMGAFGGWANLIKFKGYINDSFNVIDFGSGGGFLLNQIKCKDKIGIEINNEARKNASLLGIKSVKCTNEVSDEWSDLIISNNALEHTSEPLKELQQLYTKLKPKGKIIFVVPCESISYKYKTNDINKHLYS